jgi:ADP-dependent NAD(P)H-hydrate dehydratase / NAD(P)H-hydrate epimerase
LCSCGFNRHKKISRAAVSSAIGKDLVLRAKAIAQFAVTSSQMRDIEGRVFTAGMPVAALMEKVAGKISQRIQALYPLSQTQRVGVLAGSGHNGGIGLLSVLETEGFNGSTCQLRSKLGN